MGQGLRKSTTRDWMDRGFIRIGLNWPLIVITIIIVVIALIVTRGE